MSNRMGIAYFHKSSILVSVIVDVSILGTLFIIGLSTSAWATATNGQFVP